jgi:hypothetical protein
VADQLPDAVAPAPLLSIVVTGRNDGYGGDFNARFARALRFNHEQLDALGVPHEVVLVEWAPPADRPLLIDAIIERYPAAAESWCSTWLIDPRYHQAYTLNPRLAYMEYVAKNAGIRRAAGRFILATNTDIYLGRGVLDTLAGGALAPAVVYRATRTDVKLGADESHVDWTLLEDARNHVTHKQIRPPLYAGGTGDFLLLDRESFHALRGFNEVYRLVRLGVDVNFLVKAYGCGYRITDIGSPVYHTNHVGSYRISKASASDGEVRWGNRWHWHHVVYDNPETWGIGEAPVRRVSAHVHALDFSWDAVPPLVDLRRVLLPAARLGQPSNPGSL